MVEVSNYFCIFVVLWTQTVPPVLSFLKQTKQFGPSPSTRSAFCQFPQWLISPRLQSAGRDPDHALLTKWLLLRLRLGAGSWSSVLSPGQKTSSQYLWSQSAPVQFPVAEPESRRRHVLLQVRQGLPGEDSGALPGELRGPASPHWSIPGQSLCLTPRPTTLNTIL